METIVNPETFVNLVHSVTLLFVLPYVHIEVNLSFLSLSITNNYLKWKRKFFKLLVCKHPNYAQKPGHKTILIGPYFGSGLGSLRVSFQILKKFY